jgi:hypothetical protein
MRPAFGSYRKRRTAILAIVWLVLLAGNLLVIVQRNNGFKFRWFVSYDKLYANSDMLFVLSMQFANDTCLLQLSKPGMAGFESLSVDDSTSTKVFEKEGKLAFVMKPGVHVYEFAGNHTFSLQLDYVCTMPLANCKNELLWCTLPWPYEQPLPASTWDQSEKIFSENDLQRGKQLLQNIGGWRPGNTDTASVLAIARICSLLQSDTLTSKPLTLQQGSVSPDSFINYVIKNKPQLNCGNYAYIIRFLSAAAGLTNRSVAFKGSNDPAWSYGVHYFNEILLREKNQWVLADGLNNLFLPNDSTGRFINAADMCKMMQSGGQLEGLWGFANFQDSLQQISLKRWYKPLKRYYANPYAWLHFEVPSKLSGSSSIAHVLSFYSFPKNEMVYSDRHQNQWSKIVLKLVLFYGSVTVSLMLLFSLVSKSPHPPD